MKTSSKKAKGRALQNFVANELYSRYSPRFWSRTSDTSKGLEIFKQENKCHPDDIRPAIMGESGTDIKLSPLAKKYIPYDIECKNQENWSIPSWWRQTVANTEEGRKPLLVIKKNRHEPLVVMWWEDFKELL